MQSKIDAKTFFRKCYDGMLAEVDFDFAKAGHNEKSAKGTFKALSGSNFSTLSSANNLLIAKNL